MKKITLIIILIGLLAFDKPQSYQIALLKYNGGGDWYANPTSLPNLIAFCNKNIATVINPSPATVEVGSSEIFDYP